MLDRIAAMSIVIATASEGCLSACETVPGSSICYEVRPVRLERSVGDISDIVASAEWSGHRAVLVVGTAGAAFLDPQTYDVLTFIAFPDARAHRGHAAFDFDRDGACEFYTSECEGFASQVRVFESDGTLVWASDNKVVEWVVPFARGRGKPFGIAYRQDYEQKARLVSFTGERIGEVPWPVQGIERWAYAIDFDGDGTDELMHCNGGEIAVRDLHGRVVAKQTLPGAKFVADLKPLLPAEGKDRYWVMFNTTSGGAEAIWRGGFITIGRGDGGSIEYTPLDSSTELPLGRGQMVQPDTECVLVQRYSQAAIAGLTGRGATLLLRRVGEKPQVVQELVASDGSRTLTNGAIATLRTEGDTTTLLAGWDGDLWEFVFRPAEGADAGAGGPEPSTK